MRESMQILRETPIDARRLAGIRRQVLDRLAARRGGPGRWILAGAVSVLLLALGAALWPRQLELDAPAIAWSAPPSPEWALSTLRPAARLPEVSQPSPGSNAGVPEVAAIEVVSIQDAAEPEGPQTAVLEIPTSNPDVVLYWLVDGGGD